MSNNPEEQAMLEFVSSFSTLSGSPPERLEDLSDGVALVEALSEFAPNHFDPTTIARHLGDNWALKSSNLRKLVRNLDFYFKTILAKDASSVLELLDVLALAKDASQHKAQIATLVELLAAASVTCPQKATYVQRIMEMSGESQVEMKRMLQTSLGQLTEYTGPLESDQLEDDEDDEDDVDGSEMVFDNDDEEYYDENCPSGASRNLFGSSGSHHLSIASPVPLSNMARIEEELEQSKRQVASLKSQMQSQQHDSDRALDKLRNMVGDLQDRLMNRQDELIQVEEDLQKTVSELEETKSKLVDAIEESARLADDLDVAQAKSHQLIKTEATLQVYKKKLEQVGGVTQQMREAEDQSANYLQQIMELEAQVKRSASAQKQVEQLLEQIRRLEKERDGLEDQQKASANEVADLKRELRAANDSKRSLEDELMELRAKQEAELIEQSMPLTPQARGFDDDVKQEMQSKLSRLEVENDSLRRQLEKLRVSGDEAAAVAEEPATPVAVPVTVKEIEDLQMRIKQLEDIISQKETENKKIVSDKDKLEAYTKRTLAKFQDKYLVALQECKLKLKEKQDKIEALEQRSTAERTAQKREERLLSSTIYELGMAIMQSRLKDR
ncbi:hypothetical protein MPSEU_000633300 [Mayamaea pseudoterrestris]|nr:hypothetical protein MPSEU_000633300 [Mayamaea pseudoterrestris]